MWRRRSHRRLCVKKSWFMRFIEWLLYFFKKERQRKKSCQQKQQARLSEIKGNLWRIFCDPKMLSDEELKNIDKIVMEIVEKALTIIEARFNNVKMVKMYHNIFMEALGEILNVYDKPKPCTDFEATIEAWKRDRPAQVSSPDNLITPRFYFKNENN